MGDQDIEHAREPKTPLDPAPLPETKTDKPFDEMVENQTVTLTDEDVRCSVLLRNETH